MPKTIPTKQQLDAAKREVRLRRKRRAESGEKSDWNILFYLIGDGLISSSMISQLKAITDAGFEEDTNVLVYFDPNCNGKNARIFDVNAVRKEGYENRKTGKKTIIGDGLNSFARDIAEDCHIPSLPQIPAEITLRYFLEYARTYYPAKNYMVFLMGHGVIVGNDAFLPDPDDNSAITLSDLGWILKTFAEKVRGDGDEFQLVGFHSCSMSSVELVYELAGSALYMIGTQGAAFPGSWPYRQLLKKIFIAIDDAKTAAAGPGNQDVVNTILDGLQNLSFYNSEDFWLAGFSSDISMCSLQPKHVDGLRKPIEELSRTLQQGLMDGAARDSIRLAHLESQSYWQENYTDLLDFCSLLWKRCQGGNGIEAAIRTACENVSLAINCTNLRSKDQRTPSNGAKEVERSDRLVAYSDFYGPAYQFSNGLSIYLPWRSPEKQIIENYRAYKFTQEHPSNSWWDFLRKYFRKTQREARSTRTPWRSRPEVSELMPWRVQNNLLRTLSDQGILALGPPPAKIGGDLSKVGGDLSKIGRNLFRLGGDLVKVGGDLSTNGGYELSKVGGDLSKVGGDLSKVGGDLAEKVGGDLADKVEAELAKIFGDLSKVGGDLSKVGGDLSDKVGAELSQKVGAELAKIFGDLSKVGGDLSKVGGDLSKVGGDLSSGKVGGDLSKVGGDLSKVGGDLSKVGGDLSSTGGSELSKVGGDLGGLYGHTVIKNFASPEYQFVTSRPERADRNLFANGSGTKNQAAGSKRKPPNKGAKPDKGLT